MKYSCICFFVMILGLLHPVSSKPTNQVCMTPNSATHHVTCKTKNGIVNFTAHMTTIRAGTVGATVQDKLSAMFLRECINYEITKTDTCNEDPAYNFYNNILMETNDLQTSGLNLFTARWFNVNKEISEAAPFTRHTAYCCKGYDEESCHSYVFSAKSPNDMYFMMGDAYGPRSDMPIGAPCYTADHLLIGFVANEQDDRVMIVSGLWVAGSSIGATSTRGSLEALASNHLCPTCFNNTK